MASERKRKIYPPTKDSTTATILTIKKINDSMFEKCYQCCFQKIDPAGDKHVFRNRQVRRNFITDLKKKESFIPCNILPFIDYYSSNRRFKCPCQSCIMKLSCSDTCIQFLRYENRFDYAFHRSIQYLRALYIYNSLNVLEYEKVKMPSVAGVLLPDWDIVGGMSVKRFLSHIPLFSSNRNIDVTPYASVLSTSISNILFKVWEEKDEQ